MARKSKTENKMTHLPIEGEMTIFVAAALREKILPAITACEEIEIDLSHVTEVDGAGMQLLISAKLEAILHGKTLRYSGHSKPVLDMIDLCDLGSFFGDQVVISTEATQH